MYYLNFSHEKAIRANYLPVRSFLRCRLRLSWPATQIVKQMALGNSTSVVFASIQPPSPK